MGLCTAGVDGKHADPPRELRVRSQEGAYVREVLLGAQGDGIGQMQVASRDEDAAHEDADAKHHTRVLDSPGVHGGVAGVQSDGVYDVF